MESTQLRRSQPDVSAAVPKTFIRLRTISEYILWKCSCNALIFFRIIKKMALLRARCQSCTTD